MNEPEEKELFKKIQKGDITVFEMLFHKYYGNLCLYAESMIKNETDAEEIVQNFFVKLWEKRADIKIDTSLKNYFTRSIKNLCINYIKHSKIKSDFEKQTFINQIQNLNDSDYYFEIDLAQKIEESIKSLPEKRREIFRLSREKGLKYRQIAEKLNISIKTVEVQMGLAIKTLREKLKNYNSFFTFFIIFFKIN